MNRWQALQQVRYLLETAVWPEGAAATILAARGTPGYHPRSGIVSSSAFDPALLGKLRPPFAFVGDAGGTPDAEHPELVEARISVTLFLEHFGDPYGEAMLLGAQRETDSGTSVRRGLLEAWPGLVASVVRRGREAGLAISSTEERDSAPVLARPGVHSAMLAKECVLVMPIADTAAGEYPPARYLRGSAAGGTVTLLWSAPPVRYDYTSAVVAVVRKASSAPTSITDGTELSTSATSGYTNAPGAGTWYYGIAPAYSEPGATRYGTLATAGPFTI